MCTKLWQRTACTYGGLLYALTAGASGLAAPHDWPARSHISRVCMKHSCSLTYRCQICQRCRSYVDA